VLCCVVLCCVVLCCVVLYCIVLYCIVLYCIVLYCIVLCCVDTYSNIMSCQNVEKSEICCWSIRKMRNDKTIGLTSEKEIQFQFSSFHLSEFHFICSDWHQIKENERFLWIISTNEQNEMKKYNTIQNWDMTQEIGTLFRERWSDLWHHFFDTHQQDHR
jgi:hypothetical protein